MRPRYLLDTNVLSLLDPRRVGFRGHLDGWFHAHSRSFAVAAISLTEMRAGSLKLSRAGQAARAAEIEKVIERIREQFREAILPLDADVALRVADLGELTRANNLELEDLIIAATVDVHGMTVLTGNLRHFAPTGVSAIDPVVTPPPA